MKTGRKQHTIPRFYLERFLHPGWVYLRGFQHAKQVHSTKNVAVEDWYYSSDMDEQNQLLDSVNTAIESKTAPILGELLATKVALSDAEKLIFSYFIANLALRVPAHIKETGEAVVSTLEQANNMAKEIVRKIFKMEIEENQPFCEVVTRESGSCRYTKKEWDNFLESLRQQNKKVKAMMTETMSNIEYLAPVIANMSWVIIDATDGAFFITSDCPVYLTDINGSRLGAGWENPDAVGTLPLSPSRYLGLHYSWPSDMLGYKQVSTGEVDTLNTRVIASASHAVYSPQRYSLAESWLRRNSS